MNSSVLIICKNMLIPYKETDIVVGEPTDFGIAFAKDNQALRDEVQKVMNEMKADGTIAKISEKWFGKDITTK